MKYTNRWKRAVMSEDGLLRNTAMFNDPVRWQISLQSTPVITPDDFRPHRHRRTKSELYIDGN